jgi:hypothetical protein
LVAIKITGKLYLEFRKLYFVHVSQNLDSVLGSKGRRYIQVNIKNSEEESVKGLPLGRKENEYRLE